MSDRLSDLRRQRALLAEHLAWLDREIQAEGGLKQEAPRPAAPTQSVAAPPAPSGVPPVVAAPVEEIAEDILSQYRTAPVSVGASTKRGCLAAFAIFMALLGLATYGFYLYEKTRLGR